MSATSTSPATLPRLAHRGERSALIVSPYDKAARAVMVFTLLAAPWPFGGVAPWAWAALTGLVLVALLCWAMGCVQKGALRIVWTPLYYPLLLFLLLGVVQFVAHLTLDEMAARESVLKLATDVILFFLAGQLLSARTENRKALVRFGFIATAFALLVSLFAILQFFTSPNFRIIYWTIRTKGWVFGPYINHNHYGGLMEMLIGLAIGYLLSRPAHDPRRLVIGFAILIPIVSVLFSGSRAAFGAMVGEGLILGFILFWKAPKGSQGRRKAVWAAVLVLAAAGIFGALGTTFMRNRLAPVLEPAKWKEVGGQDRLMVARDSFRILRAHPWSGVGLGSYELAFPQFQTFGTDVVWDHAHNDYVEALAETGLVGGVLMAFALFLFLGLAFRNLQDRLRHETGWIQLGATLGCCGLLLHSFLDFNLHLPANAAWFVVLAAIAVHPRGTQGNLKRSAPAPESSVSGPAAG